MERIRSRLVVTGGMAAAALVLAACGSGGAAHVIGPGAASTPSTAAPSPSPSTAATTTAPPTTAPPTTAPPITTTVPAASGPAVDPGTVAQIDAELNALSASLSQAQRDLSSPNPGDR